MDNSKDNNELNTLEDQATVVGSADNAAQSANPEPGKKPKKKRSISFTNLISRLNIYFLFFVLVIVVAGLIVYIGYQRDQNNDSQEQIGTEQLTIEELAELSGGDARIGDAQQLLTVESNAVFSGQVLIRDNLDVAGTIKVGGDLSLPGITVSGQSNFDEIQANDLSIAGDTSIQGQLSVESNITAGGSGTFGGNLSAPLITTNSLQLSGDLQITRHIDAGGPSPIVSRGGGAGSGGTVSISGTDTAGTVTVNPGEGAGNGSVATVTFARGFSQTPHVVVTPVGRYVQFFITRTTTSFTIHVVGGLSSGSIAFDYVAID